MLLLYFLFVFLVLDNMAVNFFLRLLLFLFSLFLFGLLFFLFLALVLLLLNLLCQVLLLDLSFLVSGLLDGGKTHLFAVGHKEQVVLEVLTALGDLVNTEIGASLELQEAV